MPLYEYKCQSCGDVFEVIQKFSDTPVTVHSTCGGQVERLISTSALQFKGSGWYVNDYGKGNSKEPKPKSGDANGEGKGEGKKDKSNGSSSSSESSSKPETSSKTESSSTTPTASKPDK